MSKKIRLIYMGVRYNPFQDITRHQYLIEGTEEYVQFSSKITKFDTVGNIIECERTDKGVSSPYTQIGNSNHPEISTWSATDTADRRIIQDMKTAKKQHPHHIEKLIDKIVQETRHLDRRQANAIALSVYTKIIRG